MIKISRQTDYALQLIFALYKQNSDYVMSLRRFSIESNISFLFLQKIARALRKDGIILAKKGRSGGYRLGRDIEKITISEVVQAVHGSYGVSQCTRLGHVCAREGKCTLQHTMRKLNNKLAEVLENTTLIEMI